MPPSLAIICPSPSVRSRPARRPCAAPSWNASATSTATSESITLPQTAIAHMLSQMEPVAARNWLKALRGLIDFAVAEGFRSDNPTHGIKLPPHKTDGHHTWSETEIAAYETTHAVSTKARLALALGLYTAQRRGDVVRIGRQHIRDGVLTVRQEKTGTVLAIPVHHALKAIIEATPIGHLTLLTTKSGKSYAANDLSEQFRKWCDDAGLPQACTFHGLRKAALTRLADAGCTVHEIMAISGHKSLSEVERYTKAADQARLAREAMKRMAENETGSQGGKPMPPKVATPLKQLRKKGAG